MSGWDSPVSDPKSGDFSETFIWFILSGKVFPWCFAFCLTLLFNFWLCENISVIRKRNRSLTKEEIDAYWRSKKKTEEEHLKAISSPSDSCSQLVQFCIKDFTTN